MSWPNSSVTRGYSPVTGNRDLFSSGLLLKCFLSTQAAWPCSSMGCALDVSIIKCTPKTKEFQFLAQAGTTHLTQISEAGHFLNKTFAAKTSRHADLETIFPPLCVKHTELIRRSLTQTSTCFCCSYPTAKVGKAQNKDLTLEEVGTQLIYCNKCSSLIFPEHKGDEKDQWG